MKAPYTTWTAILTVLGIIGFGAFAAPGTPWWAAVPGLLVSLAALTRLVILGNRRHKELRGDLDLDSDLPEGSRTSRMADILKRENDPPLR